ncbi:putative E3 ubiquitin-protein ligase RF4 [Dichanthelium oligosanthes]|uniref:Putative E3 ubiquitin-protein ligase RF4 n=1 Tax=Dichanthelium oligosanthes TaxID=888268 RepID=A0A1E5W4Z8_9POAL|nr:putative E3 ubiquitin-protein ligase RF4 [Dichanthelium oligosanthes]
MASAARMGSTAAVWLVPIMAHMKSGTRYQLGVHVCLHGGAQCFWPDKHILAMGAAGNGRNLYDLCFGERDDKSSNTKLCSDLTAAEMQVNPVNDDLSLIHVKLEQSWSSVQAFVAEYMNSKDLDMDWSKEAVGLNGFRYVGCNDLRDVALNSLHIFFKTAFQMLCSEGYTEDAVVNAVVDSALCYQYDGPINKITEHARTLLQSGDHQVDYSCSENGDTVLHMLGLYFLCNASSFLKSFCPFFTLGDALWCILLCDLDISIARAAFIHVSGYGNGQSEGHARRQCNLCEGCENVNEISQECGCSSSTESPAQFEPPQSEAAQRMWSNVLADYIASIQKSAMKNQDAPSAQDDSAPSVPRAVIQHNKKVTKGKRSKPNSMKSQKDSGKDVVVFKNVQQVKGIGKTSSRMLKESKSLMAFLGSAQSTLTGISDVANKKSLQPSTLVPTQPLSGPSSVKRRDSLAVVSTGSLPSPASCSSISSSSAKAESKQQMEPDVVQFSLPHTPAEGFEFYFSRDGMQTTWVPKGREEELALELVQRLGELKLEVKVWTDWANERVMQSTNRLVNERAIILSLKKDKADVEEPDVFNRKKLEETQRALDSTSDELDRVNSHVQELTDKISHIRREKEAVQLQGKQADESLANLLRKENESMDRLKSMEMEKILLQEELVAERSKLSNLLKSLEQARRSEGVLKKRCQEGEKMLDALTKQVNFERSELERIDTSARTKSSNLLLKAQKDQEWLQANIRNIKQQVGESSSKLQRVAKFMGPPGFAVDSIQREQECAMCLEEEISVVFLPCGHQVVCAGCNQRHRDAGMAECPSCRSPIKQRICARFADS